MKRNKWTAVVAVMLCLIMALAGCGKKAADETTAAKKEETTKAAEEKTTEAKSDETTEAKKDDNSSGSKTIYVIGKESQYNHWLCLQDGAEACGKEKGYEVVYQAPPLGEVDIEKQVSMVEAAIGTKPAAIVLAPNDTDALAGVCAEVQEAGIPMVLVDSKISTEDYDCLVALDNEKAGADVAEEIAQRIGGEGQIGIISAVPGGATIMARENGFIDYIKANYPDIEIVGEILYSQNDSSKAMSQTYDMLAAYPDIKAFYTTNTPTAEGIASALEEKELGGKVLLGSFDASDTINGYIQNGTIAACSVAEAYNMGYESVAQAINLIEGKDVEKFVNSGNSIVTPANFDDEHIQELLYPFGK
ncbi:substrate-binding domain-containing protein [Lacrimispora sp. NSJ-141]|uniref:Substrate-binding domain-containing protein n=1 Tax=Lientehia hominis TaxID=2897778 RepID=A0AAP2RG59_9FIRM|nr:substrate-binding domain-containing protein [Lientehia hominis]MCD2491639.1 substrate-binding domain-containing protein [Lientehia hominis]